MNSHGFASEVGEMSVIEPAREAAPAAYRRSEFGMPHVTGRLSRRL